MDSLPEIDHTDYGILALSNPHVQPNAPSDLGVDFFLTTKGAYNWPVLISRYISGVERHSISQGDNYPGDIAVNSFSAKVDRYFSVMSDITLARRPRDIGMFKNQRDHRKFLIEHSRRLSERFGRIGQIKRALGRPLQNTFLNEIEREAHRREDFLQLEGLIHDPFIEITATGMLVGLGLVPHSYTKRTSAGDETYIKVKAVLWEYEESRFQGSREVHMTFLMEKAVSELRRIVVEWAKRSTP